MKKISISQIPSAEVLSAEEMKLLLGGNIAGKGSCKDDCTGACIFTFNKVEYDGSCFKNDSGCHCSGAIIDPKPVE